MLGWNDDDDRLDHLRTFLQAQHRPVGHALAWLRACHDAGDLDRTLTDHARRADAAPDSPKHAAKQAAQAEQLWPLLIVVAGSADQALNLATNEARAMGRTNPRDPAVIRSALATVGTEQKAATA